MTTPTAPTPCIVCGHPGQSVTILGCPTVRCGACAQRLYDAIARRP